MLHRFHASIWHEPLDVAYTSIFNAWTLWLPLKQCNPMILCGGKHFLLNSIGVVYNKQVMLVSMHSSLVCICFWIELSIAWLNQPLHFPVSGHSNSWLLAKTLHNNQECRIRCDSWNCMETCASSSWKPLHILLCLWVLQINIKWVQRNSKLLKMICVCSTIV